MHRRGAVCNGTSACAGAKTANICDKKYHQAHNEETTQIVQAIIVELYLQKSSGSTSVCSLLTPKFVETLSFPTAMLFDKVCVLVREVKAGRRVAGLQNNLVRLKRLSLIFP